MMVEGGGEASKENMQYYANQARVADERDESGEGCFYSNR